MKRSVVLAGLGILALFAMASRLSSQDATSEKKIPKEIEGLWTEIWSENGGKRRLSPGLFATGLILLRRYGSFSRKKSRWDGTIICFPTADSPTN
jgi:hypothetical protein